MEPLLCPSRLWLRGEVLSRPCPVPRSPGVYAWYFKLPLPGVPVESCHAFDGLKLLYTGISPRRPRSDGSCSKQTLSHRLRYHFRGNAEGSTLRLTLGCLLAEELGIELRRVGSGARMTFGHDGEAKLSAWMAVNARVTWCVHPEPWDVEEQMIATIPLPLNLDQNRHHAFHTRLSAIRAAAKARARVLPVIT